MIDFGGLVLGPCMAVFGEPVTYVPAGGGAIQVIGVFDDATSEQAPIDSLSPSETVNTMPTLGIQLSQLPTLPVQGDILTIVRTGLSYQVRTVHVDSHGGAQLLLNSASAPGEA